MFINLIIILDEKDNVTRNLQSYFQCEDGRVILPEHELSILVELLRSTSPAEHLIVKCRMLFPFPDQNDPDITTVFHVGNASYNSWESRAEYQSSKFRVPKVNRTKHLSCGWACFKCSYMSGFWALCGHGISLESTNPSELTACVLRVHLAHEVGDLAGFWKFKPFKHLAPKVIGNSPISNNIRNMKC